MESAAIPDHVQIEAAISGSLWTLKERCCNGSWLELQSRWTVSFEQVLAEAKKRGLENFISKRAGGEGIFLLEASSGYKIVHTERGANIYQENFLELEPAFDRWLDEELRSRGLPSKAEL